MIPSSVPKKYRDKIEFWDDERAEGNGIIVTLKGLTVDSMMPTHVFGEDTVREVIGTLQGCQPCDCEECQTGESHR